MAVAGDQHRAAVGSERDEVVVVWIGRVCWRQLVGIGKGRRRNAQQSDELIPVCLRDAPADLWIHKGAGKLVD